MADATLRSGEPEKIDYTPTGGDVSEGQVVPVGTVTGNTAGVGAFSGIAERPITNNELGSLAIGGVWDVVNANNAATGAKVYWDDSTNKVVTTSTNNTVFGWIVANGGGGANSTCRVMHRPFHNAN